MENGEVRNGFKDVFGTIGAARSLDYDEIKPCEKQQNVLQTRTDIEERKETTLERKLRVGNKKTDKFFGESLSDHLSDEPIVTSEKMNKDEVDRSSTSEKKLFFLMNMLEEDDGEKYKGKHPVEEPVFVAKKKEVKHICDDDDHMHAKFHQHEKEACDHVVPPPKPDRDFSKYQETPKETTPEKAAEVPTPKKAAEVPTQTRTRRTISRENLPTPPETPKRKSGVISMPETPTITIETIDFNTPSNDNESLEKSENIEKIEVNKVEATKAADNQSDNGECETGGGLVVKLS